MSAICQSFVQNAWRKDICSNCFRVRDEHPETELQNSVNYSNGTSGTLSADNNGVNNSPTIVPITNNTNKPGNSEANAILSCGNNADGSGGSEGNRGNSHQWSSSHKFHRFQTPPHNPPNSPFNQTQGTSSSAIPRISNGTTVNVGNGGGVAVKYSGTNSTTSTTTKGHIHSTLSGSRSSIHSSGNNLNENKDPVAETNYGKLLSSTTAETTISKSLSSSSSSLLSNSNHHQPHIITAQQQGKGLMTNQHPLKSDNGSVIVPPYHQNNNRQPMTSSALPPHHSSSSSSSSVTTASSTASTGRNISSFIASKNIFNNATTTTSNGAVVGSAVSPPEPETTGFTTTAISATSGGGGGTTNTNLTTTTSTNSSTSCSNLGPVISVAVACAGSAGLSLPQSANSTKRGNIVSASSSPPASVLASSSSSSASSSTVIQPNSQKNFGGGGVVGGFDVVITCNSAPTSTGGSHHSSRNLENCVKNGVIESPPCKKPEFAEGLSSNSNNVSNISVCLGSNNCNSGSGSNKGVAPTPTQIGMNRGKVSSASSSVATADGEIHDRRKAGFSPSPTSVSGGGDAGGMSEPGSVSKIHGKVGRPTSAHGKKGILRNKNGSRRKEKNVRFPEKVVEVIGYGGCPSGISDDEDDTPSDPMDNASVSEFMEKNSTTVEDKELHRLTQKNTNFNSIKTNLLGTTCIEIGPIVGCTGGKSMEGSSKPLVSISTFEARKEPLRIQKKICEDSADDELNEKTVEKHRKFIQRGGNAGGTISSSTTGKTLLPTSSSQVSNKSKEGETKQQTTTSTVTKGILKTTSHTTSSSSYNSSSSTTIGAISKTAHSNSNKSSSSTSNPSAPLSLNKGSGSSTTTIEVNPEHLSSASSTSLRSSKESIAVKGGGGLSGTVASRISSSSTTTASKWSNGGGGGSGGTLSAIPTTTNTSISGNNETNNLRNTKPVLKRLQQKNANSETTSSSEGTSSYTVNAAVVETSKNSTSANQNGRNNLVILTNGSNHNSKGSSVSVSNSIASQRSSFLRDIIVDSTTKTTIESSAAGETELRGPSGPSNGVQVICKNNGSSVIGKAHQETTVSLMKSELKVDLKPSVNNGKLSHPPFGECLSNRSNGTDDSSEFDDSLEDSGLDIKKCSEISESDEKSGSGSDSGNENDYSDRDRVKIISATGPKTGLFISVDEVEGNSKKPEKLSPDSVLFSSASEMSASGSSESIPEALDTVSNGSSQKSSASSSTSGNDSGSTSSSNGVKRAAPRPPANSMTEGPSKGNNNNIYANSQQSSILDSEELYDDVSFYKNPLAFAAKKDNKIPAFEEEDEENIYDDCNTITAIPKGGKSNGGKSAAGSYSFQNGSNNTLDSDGDEETEKVVQRRSDGIEFIGIRKIDSESFLRERTPTPDISPEGKRERSSSASPKTRRKVNQFFSTIGKKAGAAFSNHVHGYSSKNKSNPVIEESGIDKCPSGNSGSAYKRSLSTDEVSMTRTQEIYATLTPTSLKFKGLAPVLHKLSKMDLTMGDKDKGLSGDLDDDSKEKGYKKHKLSSSIKKFLRFGSKDGGETSGSKYEFGNCPNKTDTNGTGQMMITSQISEESMTDMNPSRTPTPTSAANSGSMQAMKVGDRRPSTGTLSGRPPPPPPPRVHSLDLLNRVGVVGLNGTVRPARPPPPTRHNRVAPSFTSVFNNPNNTSESKPSGEGNNGTTTIIINGNAPTYQGDLIDPNNPPSKPKRKASINLDCVTNGISKDLETTYNHITTLNLETLKLIASQTPTKIRRSVAFNKRNSHNNPLRWSQFHIVDPSKPLIHGHGFVFYTASLEDESCVLLVQESATAPSFSAPFEFPCVETSATFEDSIPCHYITWKASEYVTNGSNVKVFVSVMPNYSMYTVDSYMHHSQVPLLHKYFALLQAMNFWDKEDMCDLLVLVQNTEESDGFNSTTSSSPSSVLVYVHPVPHLSTGGQAKLGGKRTSSKTQLTADFESSMKQLLLSPDGSHPLLGNNDRQVLFQRLNQNKNKSIQDQFRLFIQVKLFTPKRDSEELERIKMLRSERAIQQWLDRERALCMKEAIEQTLQRSVESSISPYKRSYLEFLLTPENSAKAVLDMLIDLLE